MAYLGNAPGVESQRLTTTFTATDGQTAFNPVGGYTLGYVDAYLNGVKLIDGTDYTADDGVTVTLSTGAALNDNVELVTYTPRGLSDGYTKTEADTRYVQPNDDATLGNITSTGIDDNATSTAITIDASENVGIGTASPLQALHVNSGTGNSSAIFESTDSTSQIWLKDSASSSTYQTGIGCFGDNLLFNNGGERARIDSNGRLGIGSTAPTADLHIKGTNAELDIENNTGRRFRIQSTTANSLSFIDKTVNSERARIDSNGALLVGKTNDLFATVGSYMGANGVNEMTTDGTHPLRLNRKSSDGNIVTFNKDGLTVGSIGVDNSDNLYITGNSSHAGLMCGSTEILPYKGTTLNDGVNDIGASSFRWKDLYLSGGVISGSSSSKNLSYASNFSADGADIQLTLERTGTSSGWGGIGAGSAHSLNVYNSNIQKVLEVSSADGSITFPQSGGVYLGGTGSANKLDDYEEGTFTATLNGASAIANTVGHYTRVGQRCFFHYYSNAVTMSSAVDAILGGLPFTCANGSSHFSAVYTSHNTYAIGSTGGYVVVNGTTIELITNDSTARTITASSGTVYLMIAGSYLIA